jgi:hypothetical protein
MHGTPEKGYYKNIAKEPPKGSRNPKDYAVVVAIPLFFPLESQRVVAVMRICSIKYPGGLFSLFYPAKEDDPENKAKRNKFFKIIAEKWLIGSLVPKILEEK